MAKKLPKQVEDLLRNEQGRHLEILESYRTIHGNEMALYITLSAAMYLNLYQCTKAMRKSDMPPDLINGLVDNFTAVLPPIVNFGLRSHLGPSNPQVEQVKKCIETFTKELVSMMDRANKELNKDS